MNVDHALAFLNFVEERHRVYERRRAGAPQPWTDDPILTAHKFTNVFRVLDYGSQYVLTDLVDPELSPRDQLMRLFLYRHTGRVDAWQYADLMVGLPTVANLSNVAETWRTYRGEAKIVQRRPWSNPAGPIRDVNKYPRSVFTGAYIVFPQSSETGTDKLESIIDLTRRLFDPSSPTDIVPDFLTARTQAERFAVLRRNKGVADFMSMQVLTDWGYTPQCGADLENEFVVLGPGARRGAAALGESLTWAVEHIRSSSKCPRLGDRVPSLMDVQNCLCEYSKYARFAARPIPSKRYTPAHTGPTPPPVLPAYWRSAQQPAVGVSGTPY